MTNISWDNTKNKNNIKKHHIDFATAALVFNDPNRIEFYDDMHSTPTEERYNTIGFVHKLIFVVYTERTNHNGIEITRIISARYANTKEEVLYVSNLHNG